MTVPPSVEFHFDFGSPNAYLAHRVIPAIEGRTGAGFRYVPILLGGVFKATGNRSPVEAFGGIRNKLDYERLETERFIRQHGLTRFARNPFFPVNTLQLMRGAAAAEIDGDLPRYVEADFRHMWGRRRRTWSGSSPRAAGRGPSARTPPTRPPSPRCSTGWRTRSGRWRSACSTPGPTRGCRRWKPQRGRTSRSGASPATPASSPAARRCGACCRAGAAPCCSPAPPPASGAARAS